MHLNLKHATSSFYLNLINGRIYDRSNSKKIGIQVKFGISSSFLQVVWKQYCYKLHTVTEIKHETLAHRQKICQSWQA